MNGRSSNSATANLYELVKGRNLAVYEDADIRLSISRAVALETSRGWRIAKEKQSHKIDVVVALAQAALGAVQQGQRGEPGILVYYRDLVANAQTPQMPASRSPMAPLADEPMTMKRTTYSRSCCSLSGTSLFISCALADVWHCRFENAATPMQNS